MRQIRIGTRKSRLALLQTTRVVDKIEAAYPDIKCQVVPIVTTGDLITDRPLYDVGGKKLFVKELEMALLENKIDIAIHALKDMPGDMTPNLEVGGCLPREDERDCLITKCGYSIESLPSGAKIGTTAPRRRVYLNKIRPDLNVVSCRGNVETRMKKLLQNQEFDGLVLASCSLHRLGQFAPDFCFPIEKQQMLPAACQSVIGMQVKTDNEEMLKICRKINHIPTENLVKAERSFLESLGADCESPVAVNANFIDSRNLLIDSMVSDISGERIVEKRTYCSVDQSIKEMKLVALQMREMINCN